MTAVPREERLDRFQVLVDEYSNKLFRLAYRMTGNEADAEDVVQETFMKIHRNLNRLRQGENPSPWVHRIAANCAIDVMRRRKRTRVREQEPIEEHGELAAAGPGPERSSYGGEVQAAIHRELMGLTFKERTAFVLRHYEGMSIREIGRVLGSGENTTKNHIFRAVRKLRKALAPLVEQAT
jgi:RNA polymerase sigma-70 factor (ECF subfamily)